MPPIGRARERTALALLAGAAIGAFALRLAIGPETVGWSDLVVEFRLPQALAAALAGAALALSGLQMQTTFQNPLAGPWVLGLVAGAQFGVALLVLSGAVFGLHLSGVLSPVSLSGITLAAGIGGLCALAGALALSRRVGPTTLLVAGLLFSATLDGVRGFLVHLADVRYELLFLSWNQAGFGGITWSQVRLFATTLALGAAIAGLLAKSLNGLLLGDGYARTLGVDVRLTRRLSMLSTILLAGTATALSGAVLFIDLAVPHLCRSLLRTADHRWLVPATLLAGAAMALLADAAAGLAPGDEVLPVNMVTCLLGGPVVLWVLLRAESGRARTS